MNVLNKDQQHAADEFFKFLLSPTEKEFSISGPAGTGKTFLLQELVDKILPMYADACRLTGILPTLNTVALTAVTNRAADVLTGEFGREARTIHSFMNLRVRDNFKTGKQTIEKTGKYTIHHNTLIIIDEASMIDRQLDKIIQETTHSSCKLVYVGDSRQLAPVGESLSNVFTRPMRRVELLQQMRNNTQPALMNLCNQFRKTVETGVFRPITLVPGVIDLLSDSEMQNHVDTFLIDENHKSRILVYTNNQVKDYNNYLRHKRGYGSEYQTGEYVVNNYAIELPSQGVISAEKEFVVKNIKLPVGEITIDDMDIEYYTIQLQALKGNIEYTVKQPVNKEYFKQVLKYLGKQAKWREYFSLKNNFPDLRSKDASTVYKAQGSTFDSVYIDLQNIGTSNIADQVARMLYVAVSRPKNRVFLYGKLPDKYSGA